MSTSITLEEFVQQVFDLFHEVRDEDDEPEYYTFSSSKFAELSEAQREEIFESMREELYESLKNVSHQRAGGMLAE